MNLAIEPSGLQFLSLPEELQVEILLHMDYRSLLRCTSVCKSLNHIVKEYSSMQYIIELGANGMEATSCTLSHAALLQKLRDHLKAWEQLEWKKFRVIPTGDFIECRAYELVAGTFSTSNGSDLLVIWLPSATHDGCALHHQTIGLSIRDFAIDPTEDLIAFLENDLNPSLTPVPSVRLHLRTISGNRPHPLAREGILSFDVTPDAALANPLLVVNATLQLACDMLSLTITTGPSFYGLRALIWNWRAGYLVFDSRDDPTIMVDSQAFTMLNRETFMLTSIDGSGSLKVYAISHYEHSPATLLATLHLPELQPNCYLRLLGSHSGPVHARPPENSLFTSSLDSRIQIISAFYAGPVPGDHSDYSVFIHNDRLLSIAKSNSVGLDMPWNSWGPQHTRFLPHCVPTNWLRYVHGQRVICSTLNTIQVLDFARSRRPSSPGAHEMYLRSSPSCIPKDSIFIEDVVTYLPYYAVNRVINQRFFAYMIDEERIIGLRTNPLDPSENLELHLLAL